MTFNRGQSKMIIQVFHDYLSKTDKPSRKGHMKEILPFRLALSCPRNPERSSEREHRQS